VLINHESSVGVFLLTSRRLIYLVITICISFIFYTCWIPTISVLNLAISPCYSNLLLRRRRWTGILWWGVLGYVLPRLLFLWSYEVFRYSISLRVIIVFRDIIYIIIILYSWHLIICEHFWSVCVEQLILGYAYDEYLVLLAKSGMTRNPQPSWVIHGPHPVSLLYQPVK
jgi:hypothetical protein